MHIAFYDSLTQCTSENSMNISSEQTIRNYKRVIGIHGSKGGVGTSIIAGNLGIFLAQIGKQVLLVNADLNNAESYSWLQYSKADKNIGDIILNRVDNINEAISETGINGLYLLAGATGILLDTPDISESVNFLWSQLNKLEADYIIIDLSSDNNPFTLELFSKADYSIIVTLPMPGSIDATYRFISIAWVNGLNNFITGHSDDADKINRETLNKLNNDVRSGRIRSPRQIVAQLLKDNNGLAQSALKFSQSFHPQIIVNQTKINEDQLLGEAIVSAATRWLGVIPVFLGSIGWDDNVWLSERRTKPLLINFSGSLACKDLEEIVRRLTSLQHRDIISPVALPPETEKQNYYELLEIYPGASEEEVRRAFKQIKSWFGLDAIACQGICSDSERDHFQKLAEIAHSQLVDRSKRREYDKLNFPNGFTIASDEEIRKKKSIAGKVTATQESLPKVELTDDDFVDGLFLAKIRTRRNVDLEDISNRARVSMRYLKAIEENRFDDLPAAVFTRGFVIEFARFLKINPVQAASDFMSLYNEHHKK